MLWLLPLDPLHTEAGPPYGAALQLGVRLVLVHLPLHCQLGNEHGQYGRRED
jgi:hypothetical protein